MARQLLSRFGSALAWCLSLTIVLQPGVLLAHQHDAIAKTKPLSKSDTFADVRLRDCGVLVGQVVNASGVGTANLAVTLVSGQQKWQTITDTEGWFRFANLRGGSYRFRADGQSQMLRLWSPGTAPPQASQGLLVTPPADVFRGQRVLSPNTNQFFRVAKQRLSNPLVVGGVIVTAVAIPVAIHNSDDDPAATP